MYEYRFENILTNTNTTTMLLNLFWSVGVLMLSSIIFVPVESSIFSAVTLSPSIEASSTALAVT